MMTTTQCALAATLPVTQNTTNVSLKFSIFTILTCMKCNQCLKVKISSGYCASNCPDQGPCSMWFLLLVYHLHSVKQKRCLEPCLEGQLGQR